VGRAGRESRDLLLIDHANCEKKAASTALALMFAYAEDLELTEKMSRLAREELRHYEQVAKLVRSLGIVPRRLAPGRYATRCAGWSRNPNRSAKSI
jgi:tRNA 2-(methylsulfanyl)-N6-isopentenyladenosine37 hydroxylase